MVRLTTYDTGALIAGDRDSPAVWGMHRRLLEQGLRPSVSAAVVAQAWRGGRQASLARMLAGCDIEPLTASRAREIGKALAASGGSDVVDAAVVVGALAQRRTIVTGDPDDLRRIAEAIGFDATIAVV